MGWKELGACLGACAIVLTGSAAAGVSVPLPVNGDFTFGDLGWSVGGLASISGGMAHVGHVCQDPPSVGQVGRLTTTVPFTPVAPMRLLFDWSIDVNSGGGTSRANLQVVVLPLTGDPVVIHTMNPSQSLACTRYMGSENVPIPTTLSGVAANLEFRVYQCCTTYALFEAHIDNIRLST